MSDDWRRDLERRVKEQREVEERRQREEEEKENLKRKRKAEGDSQMYNLKLAIHQMRFKCHVCKTPSSGPGSRFLYQHTVSIGDKNDDAVGLESVYKDDWNTPGSLQRCGVCNKWTCNNCLAWVTTSSFPLSICKKDVEDGYLPGQTRWF